MGSELSKRYFYGIVLMVVWIVGFLFSDPNSTMALLFFGLFLFVSALLVWNAFRWNRNGNKNRKKKIRIKQESLEDLYFEIENDED